MRPRHTIGTNRELGCSVTGSPGYMFSKEFYRVDSSVIEERAWLSGGYQGANRAIPPSRSHRIYEKEGIRCSAAMLFFTIRVPVHHRRDIVVGKGFVAY
jgi:hypothetical protein